MAGIKNIRNFCIIAHIDHGKSTLADRFLDTASSIDKRKRCDQMLDSMELERERGITIKAKAVRLSYTYDNQDYILNLIDTPGHVDFTHEVAKSLKACEGAILLIDASQGIEAQTVANFYLALESDLKIIPVLNKIDLPSANPGKISQQLFDVFGFKKEEISLVCAKSGVGVDGLFERIVKEIPHPEADLKAPLKAILFDSLYDPYRGAILFVRVFEGTIRACDTVLLMHQGKTYKVEETGVFLPQAQKADYLSSGEVGYICCNIKNPLEIDLGDTITSPLRPTSSPFEGYKKITPMVFSGVFPSSPKDYPFLRQALEKLRLSDPSFIFEPDSLGNLGHGFRCGFLGLLHMEIVQERLEREYNLDIILTSPNVMYKVKRKNGESVNVEVPHQLPDISEIEQMYEPFVKATIVAPLEGIDPLCELAKSRRGEFIKMDYLSKERLSIVFELPLSEIIVDFYDKIKSLTKGYASLDYEFIGYRVTDIVKLDLFINKKQVESFSLIVHKDKAEQRARVIVEKFKELIPRHMFVVSVQAQVGSRIIAAEKISALRKNVTAKCYGGDVTRKRKLWEKQKKGKKKMKQFGDVAVPQGAFIEALKM
ncbi:MAG: translation elongation factor 4 [Candidatus Omnitrophota bacterium]